MLCYGLVWTFLWNLFFINKLFVEPTWYFLILLISWRSNWISVYFHNKLFNQVHQAEFICYLTPSWNTSYAFRIEYSSDMFECKLHCTLIVAVDPIDAILVFTKQISRNFLVIVCIPSTCYVVRIYATVVQIGNSCIYACEPESDDTACPWTCMEIRFVWRDNSIFAQFFSYLTVDVVMFRVHEKLE